MKYIILLFLPFTALAQDVTFEKDIKPIFQRYCVKCHVGATKYEVAFGLKHKILEKLINRKEMPPIYEGNRPTQEEIDLVKEWLDNGARK